MWGATIQVWRISSGFMHQSSSWCLWGPHIFATMSRMMPLFNAIDAQKIFWEFHVLYVSMYVYIDIHICIHKYIHICSFVFPEACSASHIFLPCATKLLVTKMNSTPKKSFIVALHSWLLYEARPPWWCTWWTQKLSPEAIINNKAMLLVDCNKQLSMAETFSVFFKHLFVVIVISTIPQPNTTMVSFYILQVEEGVLCKENWCVLWKLISWI